MYDVCTCLTLSSPPSEAQRQLLRARDELIELESQANNTNNDQVSSLLVAGHVAQLVTQLVTY